MSPNFKIPLFAEGITGLYYFFLATWKRRVFALWFLLALLLWLLAEDAETRLSGVGLLFCAASTFLFWNFRRPIASALKHWRIGPGKKFVLIGSLGAAWVEFVFWVVEKLSGVEGIAASPNLLLDLLGTMPWYILMAFLLWKVETTYRYSYTALLVFGGVYDLCADGVLGTILNGNLSFGLFLLLWALLPNFIISYSFMVLPASFLLREEADEILSAAAQKRTAKYKYVYWLLPLAGLILYSIVIIALFAG